MKKNMYKSHPWHGLSLGEQAPDIINCYIEMVPTDTVKYELDKETGILKIDRPQKFSSLCPTLYGLIPQTYAGERVAKHCIDKTNLEEIVGDHDPLDICVLTEKDIPRGDIIVSVIPIGGFRMIDNNEADDKIIGVLKDDLVFGAIKDVSDCPQDLIKRLRHYFLTYKGVDKSQVQITHTYNCQEAKEIIKLSTEDYKEVFP